MPGGRTSARDKRMRSGSRMPSSFLVAAPPPHRVPLDSAAQKRGGVRWGSLDPPLSVCHHSFRGLGNVFNFALGTPCDCRVPD